MSDVLCLITHRCYKALPLFITAMAMLLVMNFIWRHVENFRGSV